MTKKDFWHKSSVAVIGGGSWGTVLAALSAQNCEEVRIWVREEELARAINTTRTNPNYVNQLELSAKVRAYTDPARVLGGSAKAVIWALPSSACREQSRRLAPYFGGDELVMHATKGVEEGTLKRISQVLAEELPVRRIGVISGPNLAHEIAENQPAATVVASTFNEVVDAGMAILGTRTFRVYGANDVVGVEWAGALKNILAIAAGTLDALNLGWNTRAMLMARGLAEMVRFSVAMGAEPATFLGLAGMGDLLATCSSPLSRNYRVGVKLAQGLKLPQILTELGSTAEGVKTAQSVWEYARTRKIEMPITEGVYRLVRGEMEVRDILGSLMTRPFTAE